MVESHQNPRIVMRIRPNLMEESGLRKRSRRW
jgi:hypothetical protein